MGAALDYVILKGDRSAIQTLFNRKAEDSRYMDGHMYSGCIGMLRGKIDFRDVAMPGKKYAIDYLADTHQKWDGPMAVSFTDEHGDKAWVVGGWCSS